MIFVTVGANTPFDRLVRCVDEWAATLEGEGVVAQIGETEFRPQHCEWTHRLAPAEFSQALRDARVVIAHAGMGTILSALEVGVPILVMPRRAALHEMRNDHQLATAGRLGERGLVNVALDETMLRERLEDLDSLVVAPPIGPTAPPPLIEHLRDFVRSS